VAYARLNLIESEENMKRVFVLTLVVAGLAAVGTAVGNQDGSYLNQFVRVLADGQPPPPIPPKQNDQKAPWLTADGQPPPPPWFQAV